MILGLLWDYFGMTLDNSVQFVCKKCKMVMRAYDKPQSCPMPDSMDPTKYCNGEIEELKSE